MSNIISSLLHGMVFETQVESITGEYLYSDFAMGKGEKDTLLNRLVRMPFIGILAGVVRVALGIIHTVGHLLASIFTCKKGHLFHAAKGGCEILRGLIEMIPIIGRIFAGCYGAPYHDSSDYMDIGSRAWWMIKIYNPTKPDGLDQWMDNWVGFPRCFYKVD
jgi:hypothetical protein